MSLLRLKRKPVGEANYKSFNILQMSMQDELEANYLYMNREGSIVTF